MKTVKMSLANIQGKMSRKEMKEISGGCGYRYTTANGTFGSACNLSYAQASSSLNWYLSNGATNGHWCCSQCGTASWC